MNHCSPTSNDGLILSIASVSHHSTDVIGVTTPFRPTPSLYHSSRQTASPLASPQDEFRSKGEASTALLSLTGLKASRPTQLQINGKTHRTMRSVENDIDKFTERHKRKRAEISQSRRREQCRANQARYRDKQRNAQMTLEKSVEQLHQELDVLKCKYRDLSSHGRSNQSPWSIAAEFFQLVETSFRSPWIMSSTHEMEKYTETRQLVTILERAFAKDVALGELRRADALMEQLRLYSHYFGEPDLQLQRIESMAPHVTAAHGILSVTVTEITLQHVFSHVKKPASGDQTEVSPKQLYQRLLGQRLECSCLVIFLFNKASDHVVRLVATIDLIPALLRVLGNLRDVSKVFEHAQVSSESVIGCSR